MKWFVDEGPTVFGVVGVILGGAFLAFLWWGTMTNGPERLEKACHAGFSVAYSASDSVTIVKGGCEIKPPEKTHD